MVCQGGGDFPATQLAPCHHYHIPWGNILGITNTRKPGPADIRAMRKQINKILGLGQLVKVRRPLNTASEESRCHCVKIKSGEEWRVSREIRGRREKNKKRKECVERKEGEGEGRATNITG